MSMLAAMKWSNQISLKVATSLLACYINGAATFAAATLIIGKLLVVLSLFENSLWSKPLEE